MVAHALLPEKFVFQQRGKEMAWHLGGDGRAVVVIDVDGKFSITKVVHMILRAANELEPGRMAEAAGGASEEPSSQKDSEDPLEDLIADCLSRLEIVTCVDSAQLLLTLQSLAFTRRKANHSSWLLAIDSISPFHFLDRNEGPMGFKAQLATSLTYLFAHSTVACVVTKALVWAPMPGQVPREFMGTKWANDIKKHRLRLYTETSRSGRTVRMAAAQRCGEQDRPVLLEYTLSERGPVFERCVPALR